MKFHVFTMWNFESHFVKFHVLTLWNFKFSQCEISRSYIVKFQVLTLWNVMFSYCEISSSHIVKFQVLTVWNFEFSHCEISNSHIAKFWSSYNGDCDEYCLLGCHYTRCGRKVMRLATLCMNRQCCCLPLHMAVRLTPSVDSVQVWSCYSCYTIVEIVWSEVVFVRCITKMDHQSLSNVVPSNFV